MIKPSFQSITRGCFSGYILTILVASIGSIGLRGSESPIRPLVIQVVHRDTRAALAGAPVFLQLEKDVAEGVRGESDPAGQCRLNWANNHAQALRLTVRKPGFTPEQMTWANQDSGSEPPGSVTVALTPSQKVGGAVQNETGQPVAGARVTINFPQRPAEPTVPVEDLTMVTDAKGHWETDIVPVDAAYVRITAAHPDYTEPKNADAGEPSLESSVAFSQGQIVAEIQGWPVKIADDGSFLIEDLPAGKYSLNIMAYHQTSSAAGTLMPGKLVGRLRHGFSVAKEGRSRSRA